MYRNRVNSLRLSIVTQTFLLLSAATMSAHAGAPIRYGHSDTSTKTSQQSAPVKAKVYAANFSRSDDLFFYPDEKVDFGQDVFALPQKLPAKPIKNLNGSDTAKNICDIDDAFYRSYAKFGKPYKIEGVQYHPSEDPFYNRKGTASWYGKDFHGKATANGEVYDMWSLSAAHPTLPLPSYVRVKNLKNGKEVVVRVNDRGPFKKNRLIDLSKAAAIQLDMVQTGTAQVSVEYLGPAEKAGTQGCSSKLQHAAIKEPVAPAPKPLPQIKHAAMDMHFVQIGSFADPGNAKGLLSQAQAHYKRGDVVFANVNGSGRYRVVLGPFNTQTEAKSTLSLMKSNGFEGLVIKNPS